MNKKAYLLGFLSKYRPNVKRAADSNAEAEASANKSRFLNELGNYKNISDAALNAYRRGTVTTYDWFGRPTYYPSMGGRDSNNFSEDVKNRKLYGDIQAAIQQASPEAQNYALKTGPYYNPWKFVQRYLKGMQPYVDRRKQKIMDDPKSFSPVNRHRILKHENGKMDGVAELEAIYDKAHEDELEDASDMAVLPDDARDSYQKARIWGAFNPVNYKKDK